jgi:uncharacterized protein (DUF58 family)
VKPSPLSVRLKRRAVPPPLPGQRGRGSRYLQHRDLSQLKDLLFSARTVVEGLYAGRHVSGLKGQSPEFVEYRGYNLGDPLETVDWRAFARTDREYVRVTRKETDMNCHLLLDCSGSMSFAGLDARGGKRVSKFDYACLLAAALAYLAIRQGDKAGLTLFDADIRAHFPCRGTFQHLRAMLGEVERNVPADRTAVEVALRKAYRLMRHRALVIVISDFYGEPDAIFRALNLYRHGRFDVILFQVFHEQEYRLPDLPAARFTDLETREHLTCNAAELRSAYEEQLAAFVKAMQAGAAARRMDYHLVTTDTPYHRVLRRYLVKRSQARV